PVKGVHFSSPNGTILKVPIPADQPSAYCIRRQVLDNILFEHATKVCEFRESTQVVSLMRENEKVVGVKVADLSTKQTREITANIVIGADGTNSVVAQHLNANELPANHACVAVRAYFENVLELSDHIEIHFTQDSLPGYFWIFPLENGQANVGVGMVLSEIQKRHVHLPQLLEKIIQSPRFAARFKEAKKMGETQGWTLPFGSHRRTLSFDGALLCGDAAALIDPFTGEGIGNALLSGKIAGETVAAAHEKNDFSRTFLMQYENEIWNTLGAEFETSFTLQKWARYPFLLNMAIKKAATKPRIRSVLSGMLLDEQPRQELVKPLNWFKLLVS
ncbi:MAG: NAD(P)/FAD-dependent oxidoreductase, partial [archaeon]